MIHSCGASKFVTRVHPEMADKYFTNNLTLGESGPWLSRHLEGHAVISPELRRAIAEDVKPVNTELRLVFHPLEELDKKQREAFKREWESQWRGPQ